MGEAGRRGHSGPKKRGTTNICAGIGVARMAAKILPDSPQSRGRAIRGRALDFDFTACRLRMNVPATGIIHAGPGSLTRRNGAGRTQGPDQLCCGARRQASPLDGIDKGNWTQATAFPPDSVAHPRRMHPCQDAGNRAMSVPGAGNRAAKRGLGGWRRRTASDMRGISVSCAGFQAGRSRLLRPATAPDNCCYRASVN